jgi:hypothetical protein
MTSFNELFKKDIARTIETVIKADDNQHIFQEVDEYVITQDVSKKLGDFFESYNDAGGTNGVWISGFFGSGKSHLLKILSYVLSNQEFNGMHLGELFADKVSDDAKLKADILNATKKFRSESILFNIDQQAQITSKTDANAILQVFYKVFYDHQGFYGFQPHVAEFENYLSKEGKFDDFRTALASLYHKTWEEARKDYVDPLFNDAVAEALGKVYGADPAKYEDYLESWEDRQKFSIEDFALKVSEYIQSQGPHFRLNFFVDEVGQYIAENTRLMLNLQTIAESLNTKCKGNSWVLVTSQEDLESLVGDDTGIQSDDFSKIQGRFRVRMPLTSANVDEVIEKRLLSKNDAGLEELSALYQHERENLKTLLSFSETGMQFKGYAGTEDFVSKYPFIPYQFDLFQQSIKSLSRHNVFQGKHQSVGERSMLGVFQEILKNSAFPDTSNLVGFDKMFEGLRATLRSEVQNSVILAERQLTANPLAIRVLKVLFLIKYYDNFKATSRNISVLLLDSLKINPVKHHEEIEQALNLLEQQTYIQRKGEVYEYLTDDEKDVEEEIKNVSIEPSQVSQLLDQLIFDGIIKDTKIRFASGRQEFEFTRKVDGTLFGREKELKIEFISPENSNYQNDAFFSGSSMGDNTLMLVKLPEDKRLMYEARLAIKTDKYIRQAQSTSNKENVTRILFEKGKGNSERKTLLGNSLNKMIAQSTIYINGRALPQGGGSDGRARIIDAMQHLIGIAYPKLSLLGNANLDETQLRLIMTRIQADLFGGDDENLSAAETEVLNFVNRRKQQHDRTSLSDLRDHFSKKPYGWSQMAVWCVAALLFKRGKIEGRDGSNALDDKSFAESLNNNRLWMQTLLIPQVEFDKTQVNLLKTVYQEFFNESCPKTEARDVAMLFKEKAAAERIEINSMLSQADRFPFVRKLEPLKDLLERITEMDYAVLLSSIKDLEDSLLDDKENVLDPIRQFWNGEQKRIYEKMKLFLSENNANFDLIEAPEKEVLRQISQSETPYLGNEMRELKTALDSLSDKILTRLKEERRLTSEAAKNKLDYLTAQPGFSDLQQHEQNNILRPLEEIIKRTGDQKNIANLRLERDKLDEVFTAQLNELMRILAGHANEDQNINTYITLRSVESHVRINKVQLQTEADVLEYIEALKQAMLQQIQENRQITLNA